jgi:hypothetical protein
MIQRPDRDRVAPAHRGSEQPTPASSGARHRARRPFEGNERPDWLEVAEIGRNCARSWNYRELSDTQIDPKLSPDRDPDCRARWNAWHPGARPPRTRSPRIGRLRGFGSCDILVNARAEQAAIPREDGLTGSFHPGMVATGHCLDGRQGSQYGERKPCDRG